jgi:hypothetical protein
MRKAIAMRIAPILALLILGCGNGCGPAPTPVPPPVPEPTPTPVETTCEAVCAHGDQLGCDWAATQANCSEVCNNVQASGILRWDLDCRIKAETCAAVDECERN